MKRRLSCALALLAALAFAPAAAAAVPDLGTPPWKCGHGVFGPNLSGCYGADTGDPNAMNDTGVGDVSISPHVVHQGELITVRLSHLPGWIPSWPTFGPAGLVQQGTCTTSDTSCTYKAFAATNAWARFTQIEFCFFGCGVETDYYAVVDEGREISGTVTKPDPHDNHHTVADAGVEVQMAKQGGGTVVAATNPDGRYDKLVADGTYKVATSGRHCVLVELPQCNTSKTVTVGGNQTIDFTAPPPVQITGIVKDEDGVAVKGITIRANASDTGARLAVATSGADGKYSLSIPKGPTRLSADDPQVCAIGAGSACDKVKELDVQRDTAVDWKFKGCVTTVTFGSLAAVNGCFKKTGDQEWETEKDFRMDGIDVSPNGKVTFDGKTGIVAFQPTIWKFRGQDVYSFDTPFEIDFNAASVQLQPTRNLGKLMGVELPKDAITLTFASGSTTLGLSVEWSRDLRRPEGLTSPQPKGACSGTTKVSFTLQLNNTDGLKSAGFELGGSETACIPAIPGADDNTDKPAGITLKSVKGSYDFPNGYWTVGGTVAGLPLFGTKGGVELTASLTLGGTPFGVRGITAQFAKINKLVYPGLLLFAQRGGFSGSVASETGPISLSLNAGFSVGPGLDKAVEKEIPYVGKVTLIPKEEISIDPTLTYNDKDRNPLTLDDASLTGTGAVKVWDYPLFSGNIAFLPGPFAFTFDGKFGFSDPSGQFINISGSAGGFLDVSRSLLYLTGRTYVSLPYLGLSSSSAEAVLNSDKHVIAFCSAGGPDPAWGFQIDYKSFSFDWAGCDLKPFKASSPVQGAPGAGPAAAGGAKRLALPTGSKLVVVEVTGKTGTAPKVAVGGPGLRMTPNARGAAQKGRSRIMPLPNGKTYVVLSRPRAGTWTITPQAGSSVRRLRYSVPAPAARVSGSVSDAGCKPTLKWAIAPQPGQVVRIVDRGADGSGRVLVLAAKSRGTRKLTPVGDGLRTVQAQVLQGGGLRSTIDLGSYEAATSRAAAPRGLRVSAAGKRLRVSWKPACGAGSYLVQAGSAKAISVKGTSTTVSPGGASARVRVTSVGAGGVSGRSATAPLQATATP